MKKLTLAAGLALGLIGGWAAPALAADPVHGVWKTEPDGPGYAHVTMTSCGATLCAKITETFRDGVSGNSPLIGTQLVWDMVPMGDGKYGKGKIYQPSTEKTFNSKMVLKGNVLTVSGCIGPICKKQKWTRVK